MTSKPIAKLWKWKWILLPVFILVMMTLIVTPSIRVSLVHVIRVTASRLIHPNTHAHKQNKPPAAVQGLNLPPTTQALSLPIGFFEETVVSGLSLPVAVDWAHDGRMFIAEKAGIVRVFENDTLLPTPFIDISARVNSNHDRGLLGIAINPDFPNTPYVYLLFTYDPPELARFEGRAALDGAGNRVARLIRVTADISKDYNIAIPGSEVVLLGKNSTFQNIKDPGGNGDSPPSCDNNGTPIEDCLPIDDRTHTIGAVTFGADGSLFVSNGDGSCELHACLATLRAQNLDSLAGKIMRINPLTGSAYPDNPFFDGNLRSNRSKVYSYGLRNPFRFAVNPSTNEIYIGDVGSKFWEEIDTGRGANFGWPCYEGGSGFNVINKSYAGYQVCQDLYKTNKATPAIYAWYRLGTGSAVMVGDFYRGTIYPAEYRGAFFFGDYVQGYIRYITPDLQVRNFASGIPAFVQMKVGPDSNLYYVNIATGQIMRFRYVGSGKMPPAAIVKAVPANGLVPLQVAFSAEATSPKGSLLTYNWSFGDGSYSTFPKPTHLYTANGVYTVLLTVTDNSGASNSSSVVISVGNRAPAAKITTPANNSVHNVGEIVNFSGTGTDAEDGALKGDSLKWEVVIHHNTHVHYDYFHGMGDSGSFTFLDHEDDSYLELCLTVKDSAGLQDKDCVNVLPRQVAYTFNTVPPGLVMTYSGVTNTTPFTVNASVGGQRSIEAPQTQSNYRFLSWSDRSTPSHTIVIQASPQTLIATYEAKNAHGPNYISIPRQ